ncbi:MAG: GtrA family protein [Chlorobiaceae bacterium]|nr:GtrA family protein [Chlorobiaceae bacterium]
MSTECPEERIHDESAGTSVSQLFSSRYRDSRYLVAAGWNTLFGYLTGVGLYSALSEQLHVTVIGFIGNFISITMSFVVYKLMVFRTKGNWISEYIRCNIVYGSGTVVGIALLWFLVDYVKFSIWIAQFLIIFVTAAISYFGHKGFTFKR